MYTKAIDELSKNQGVTINSEKDISN